MNIALFASGTGSNVYNIIEHFKSNDDINVVGVLSNRKEAGALNHGKNAGILTLTFTKSEFKNTAIVEQFLTKINAEIIVLAGFLLKVPEKLIKLFPNKIINVHPALLPNYGGKGMYGMNVHNAVITANESKSGITVHLVNDKYDEGEIIAQFECLLMAEETTKSLAQKISILEKTHFPKAIENYILKSQ